MRGAAGAAAQGRQAVLRFRHALAQSGASHLKTFPSAPPFPLLL